MRVGSRSSRHEPKPASGNGGLLLRAVPISANGRRLSLVHVPQRAAHRSVSASLDARRFCRHMSQWHSYLVRRLVCTSMAADRTSAESVSHAGRWVVESWCDWGCVGVRRNHPKFLLDLGYGTLSRLTHKSAAEERGQLHLPC